MQVGHLPLEAAAGEGQVGDGGQPRGVWVEPDVEFGAGVGGPGDEEVDHAYAVARGCVGVVVVGRDESQALSVVKEFPDTGGQVVGAHRGGGAGGRLGVHGVSALR